MLQNSPGSRTLRAGSAPGPDVRRLQSIVGVPEDGVFGPRTRDALAGWQLERGLVSDGVAGPATWRAMGALLPGAPAVFLPPIVPATLESWVQLVQSILQEERCTDPAGWAPVLVESMDANGITPGRRAAAYLPNIINETHLSQLVENMTYTTSARLMANWPARFPTVASCAPYLRNGPALAEKVYGGRYGNNQPGDGWLFRGRGLIQVTFRGNYEPLAKRLGIPLLQLLEMMEHRQGASDVSALWWSREGINEVADKSSFEVVRRRVNGGVIGMRESSEIFVRHSAKILAFAAQS